MRIAIIGSHGYIGSFLYQQLSSLTNFELFAFTKVSRNIPQNNLTIINGRDISTEIIRSFDVIIYTAGISGFSTCEKYTWDQLTRENVADIHEVVKKMLPTQLLIYMSTCVVYEGNSGICTEQSIINETALSNYGKSFYERDKLLQSYIGPKCIGLRLGTVNGISPVQNITRIYIAMMRDVYLYNVIKVQNPESMRPMLDIHDLYNVVYSIITSKKWTSTIFNISSFNASVADIAQQISKYTGAPIKIYPSNSNAVSFSMDSKCFSDKFNYSFIGSHKTIIEELLNNIAHICKDDIKSTSHCSICRICNSKDILQVLDLHEQPLANNFTEKKIVQKKYPLCLERCRNCNHTQLNYIIPPERLFSHYLYASGTNKTINTYFEWFAYKCVSESQQPRGNVLEIASNDGTQLDYFKLLGWTTFGVDPAVNLSEIARAKGHVIYTGYWGVDSFDIRSPDIIVAQNVLAHVPNPVEFLRACANIMSPRTKLYVQTSQCNMYMTGEFDTIYHEHLSFFTGHSFKKIAELTGLTIIGFEKTPIHGTSFLVTFSISPIQHSPAEQLGIQISDEIKRGMLTDFFWIKYRCNAQLISEWLITNYFSLKDRYTLVAYGAAAKGMTLLNYINVPGISMIVDDSPLKQNTLSPYQDVPVASTQYLKNKSPMAILILAWNFFDEIVKNIQKLREDQDTLVVVPFPKQTIYIVNTTSIELYVGIDR